MRAESKVRYEVTKRSGVILHWLTIFRFSFVLRIYAIPAIMSGMMFLRKSFSSLVLALFVALSFSNLVEAQEFSGVIPQAVDKDGKVVDNKDIECLIKNTKGDGKGMIPNPKLEDLGSKIYCGTVSLNDIPALIVYLIQWLMTLVGGICVIMIMIGGVQYMIGGVTDDKEQGKKTVIYALGGLIVAMFAWIIVELVQVWLTS